VSASRETPESREQVVALGRAIVAGRERRAPPALLHALPERAGSAFAIRRDRTWFLRSPLVLNAAYYLGSENMLDLSNDTEAVIASYEAAGSGAAGSNGGASSRPHVLVVRYPSDAAARKALEHFAAAYLKAQAPAASAQAGVTGIEQIEHGYVGYRLQRSMLAVVLDAPGAADARSFLDAIRFDVPGPTGGHGGV
jgi:hypothetical protein